MRRWLGVAVAVASAAAFAGCDLGLAPFVEPNDAAITPPTTTEGGVDASKPAEDARVPDDATTTDAADAAADAADAGPLKRVFVTSTVTNGNVGGVAGGDAKCAAAAVVGNLGGTFVVWLSVAGTAAPTRITGAGPWYLVGGTTRVFANKAAITTSGPEVPIDRDEKGIVNVAPDLVWTATQAVGTAAGQNCNNFTGIQVGQNGVAGSTKEKNAQWTQVAGNSNCQNAALHLYCFEQ